MKGVAMQPLFFTGEKKGNTDIVMAFIDAWNNMDWDGTADLLTDEFETGVRHNLMH